MARQLRPTRPIERIWDAGLSSSFIPPQYIDRRAVQNDTLKLLWVGRMLPRKALELAIQALGKVDRNLPITLTVVGGQR